MEHDVYVALGSNIGDRATYLSEAIALLDENEAIRIKSRSSIYETDPVGYVDQQSFLNMVILIQTSLSASELLEVTQAIEHQCGRNRDIRWGPRTIDLDILLYDQENIEMDHLMIPHPRMWERAFVIVPLMELDSTIVTQDGQSIQDIDKMLEDKNGVKKWRSI